MAIITNSTTSSNIYFDDVINDDLLRVILRFVEARSGLRQISSCALVSKKFLQFCLDSCASLSFRAAFIKITAETLRVSTPTVIETPFIGPQEILALDQEGWHYSRSHFSAKQVLSLSDFDYVYARETLIIFNPAASEFIYVNPSELIGGGYLEIIACHPTKTGFVLVHQRSCSLWSWDKANPPKFEKCVEFDKKIVEFVEGGIETSAFLNGRLFVSALSGDIFSLHTVSRLFFCDIECDKAIFHPIYTSHCEYKRCNFKIIHGKLCVYWSAVYQEVKLTQSPNLDYELEAASDFYKYSLSLGPVSYNRGETKISPAYVTCGNFLANTSEWSLFEDTTFTFRHSVLHILKQDKVWIDNLVMPNAHQFENYLIQDDFLFLCYSTYFELFYLPSKYKFSAECGLINQFLNLKKARIFWLGIIRDNSTVKLKILYHPNLYHTDLTKNNTDLHCLEIPLKITEIAQGLKLRMLSRLHPKRASTSKLQPKNQTELSKPESTVTATINQTADVKTTSPQAQPTASVSSNDLQRASVSKIQSHAENPPQKVDRTQKDPTSPLSYKVVLVAGCLFLTITAVASLVLVLKHPGSIVYQGSGVILTLPAVLTLSIGGSISLLTIAVGSYLWWKQRDSAVSNPLFT